MPVPSPRTILITGCSSGIGLCCARGLQQRGYRVFATARKEEDVARLDAEGLESLQLDVTDSHSIDYAVAEVLARTDGELYALFNNGAYGQPGAVEDLRRDVLKEQFETNVFGWHELTCKVVPVMRRQGYGRIIHNSSVLGFAAMTMRGAYNASKFAIEGLADTLRLELMGSGVHVILIEPGPIESRFRANALAHFKKHIDIEASHFREAYIKTLQRLESEGAVVPFTLPPEAVLKKLVRALESPRPKARYPVTVPTHVFAWLKRILPVSVLDRILVKI